MKNNFGISFSDRALEFLVDYLKIDAAGKTPIQIKSEVFGVLSDYPIKNCDDVLELFSQYSIYLDKWPYPGKMSEAEFRGYIRECIKKSIRS